MMKTTLLVGILTMATGCELILGIGERSSRSGPVGTIMEPPGEGDIDAGTGGGENTFMQPCHPLGNDCSPDEKCASFVDQVSPPITRTLCVADGFIPIGAACAPVEAGADDCVGGSACVFGECRPNCGVDAFDCPTGEFPETCVELGGLYTDVGGVGVCNETCDVVFQTCSQPGLGCYITDVQTGQQTCGAPLANITQGDQCVGPDTETCFANGCAEGYLPALPSFDGTTVNRCAFACTPVDTHMQAPDEAAGSASGIQCGSTFGDRPSGPGGGHQCRFLESFYPTSPPVSPAVGFCVDPAEFGDCTECDATDLPSAQATCAPGCLSLATVAGLDQPL